MCYYYNRVLQQSPMYTRKGELTTLRSGYLANILIECFSLHQGERSARFSDLKLKVGIRELSYPFMQEPAENNNFAPLVYS